MMHILLWVAPVLLAGAFGMAGVVKATQPVDALVQSGLAWAGQVPLGLVRFIGTSELLGAVGLILPAATKVKPSLMPLAALGLLTIMILAMGLHLSRGELQVTPINIVLGLAAFVAWGRTKKVPIR